MTTTGFIMVRFWRHLGRRRLYRKVEERMIWIHNKSRSVLSDRLLFIITGISPPLFRKREGLGVSSLMAPGM
jgi:hypothetical protein